MRHHQSEEKSLRREGREGESAMHFESNTYSIFESGASAKKKESFGSKPM